MFVFYMLTSALMFTLLDEKFDARTMAWAISLSFLPVIFNCLIYLVVLYDMDRGGNLQEMLYRQSSLGLSIADMEQVSYIFWLGFYLFFALLTRHEFNLPLGKSVAVTFMPTFMVMTIRYLF